MRFIVVLSEGVFRTKKARPTATCYSNPPFVTKKFGTVGALDFAPGACAPCHGDEEDGRERKHVDVASERRVLGTINAFGRMLEVYLDGRPLPEAALHLADASCSPIGMGRGKNVARAPRAPHDHQTTW